MRRSTPRRPPGGSTLSQPKFDKFGEDARMVSIACWPSKAKPCLVLVDGVLAEAKLKVEE